MKRDGSDTERMHEAPARGVPHDFGWRQAMDRAGLAHWQWSVASTAGLITPPDVEQGRWSAAALEEIISSRILIISFTGVQAPIGSHRAALYLAERTGLPVEPTDVEILNRDGFLHPTTRYRGRPLWSRQDLSRMDAVMLAQVIARRLTTS